MPEDYYKTLGISKGASADEIKRAYRVLAHKHHPDKGGGDEQKFKQASEAYQVLSNPEKRQQYDQYGQTFDQARRNGQAGPTGSGFGGFDFRDFDFGGFGGGDDAFDVFSDIFGGGAGRTRTRRQRGVDLEMELPLTFEEAVFGAEKELSLHKTDVCKVCAGSGAAPGSKVSACLKCHGQGQIRTARRTIFGQMAQVIACDECEGSGKVPEVVCVECRGAGTKKYTKQVKVRIPAGVTDGQTVRIPGEGEMGYKGSSPGDLYLRLQVSSSQKFERDGANILSEVPISFYQAALGAIVEADTVDGKIKVKIPAGTQSGKVFRIKDRGVPHINRANRGDHLLTVRVVTPTRLNKKEKELLRKLAEDRSEEVETKEGFWSF